MGVPLSRPVSLLLGFAWPAYCTFRLLDDCARAGLLTENQKKEKMQRLLAYWIVITMFHMSEYVSDPLLGWLPFYFWSKLGILFWLQYADFSGAGTIYRVIIGPILTRHRGTIDGQLAYISHKISNAIADLFDWSTGLISDVFSKILFTNPRSRRDRDRDRQAPDGGPAMALPPSAPPPDDDHALVPAPRAQPPYPAGPFPTASLPPVPPTAAAASSSRFPSFGSYFSSSSPSASPPPSAPLPPGATPAMQNIHASAAASASIRSRLPHLQRSLSSALPQAQGQADKYAEIAENLARQREFLNMWRQQQQFGPPSAGMPSQPSFGAFSSPAMGMAADPRAAAVNAGLAVVPRAPALNPEQSPAAAVPPNQGPLPRLSSTERSVASFFAQRQQQLQQLQEQQKRLPKQ